jgi:Gpi18-like mannosyltransferase
MEKNMSDSLPASSIATPSKRTDTLFAIVAGVLTLCIALVFKTALTHNNPDISYYYQKWYQHIVTYGRWSSLEGSYANYSPPYLYILSFVSLFAGNTSQIVMVKLAQVPGLLVGAWLFWSLCRKLGCSQTRSLLAAWLFLVAPEVFQNTILWGQCDVVHTACLLGMLRLLLAKRPGWAMFVFGVALAFKLQAIFAGAVIAALLLSGEVPLWCSLCVPAGFVVMMVPAWLAGRPWAQLVLIYHQQYQDTPDIARDVANPLQLMYHFSRDHMRLVYPALKYVSFLAALLVSAWLVYFLARSRWRLRGQRLIVALAATLLVEPYLLPKMHDRYFFAGDIMVFLLVMVRPKLWLPAAMLQISALIVSYPHLYEGGSDKQTRFYVLPVLLTTIGLIWVWKILLSDEETLHV